MPTNKKAIFRTDVIDHQMNENKRVQVVRLVRAWREVAALQSQEQWKFFFKEGVLNKAHNASRTGYEKVGTSYGQMVRWQVVGQIKSWLSNRALEFTQLVKRSNLPAGVAHQLHFINRWKAWYSPEPLFMKDGTLITESSRKLARVLFRRLLKINKKPNLSKVHMMVDQRTIQIEESAQSKKFTHWARLSTLQKGMPIDVPLIPHEHHLNRKGQLSASVQIIERDGAIEFGLMKDVSAAYKDSTDQYTPQIDILGLDLGLRCLFATSEGDLLGRNWLDRLHRFDKKITSLASHRQSRGLQVRSPRYKAYVQQLRGFIRSEVGRILNQLVRVRKPAELVIEKLRFHNSNLSKRLNRLLNRFGKSEISRKLQDLNDQYGIKITEVNPAYTSQTHSECGYVSKGNRKSQSQFHCGWCNEQVHADVNASRNLRIRRSDSSLSDVWKTKHAILDELVKQFNQRINGLKGGATDPRMKNHYFFGSSFAIKVT